MPGAGQQTWKRLALVVGIVTCAATARGTIVVDDDFSPPGWDADYGVFHRVETPTGQSAANPAAEVQAFQSAGFDGSGVKIGLIGDPASQAALTALIQQIAPGANVVFESGFDQGQTTVNNRPTRANITTAIQNHQANGVDIIVDGASYLTEPLFDDHPNVPDVGQAVQDARDAGITYFSAAGDLNGNAYRSAFNDSGIDSPLGGENIHSYGGSDLKLSLTVKDGEQASFAMQWEQDQGFFVNLDLAVQVNNGADGLFISRREQRPPGNGDGDGAGELDTEPWEIVTWTNDTGADATVDLVVLDNAPVSKPNESAAALQTMFELLWVNAELDDTVGVGTLDVPTVFGHGLNGAILVGSMDAVDARDVYEGVVAGLLASVDDSSSRIDADDLFDGSGDPQRTMLVGPDNWSVNSESLDGTVFSSAYLAALSALMLEQADQSGFGLTSEELEQLLIAASIDINDPDVDVHSGYGLVDPGSAFNGVSDLIPEPSSALLLLGATGLLISRRRR